MKTKYKVTIAVVVVVVVIGGIIGVALMNGDDTSDMRTVVLSPVTLVQDVSFTGHLQSKQEALLGFEFSGVLSSMNVAVGDSVEVGQVLATLDTRAMNLDLAKAQADKSGAQEEAYLTWQNAERAVLDTQAEQARTVELKRQVVRDAKTQLDQYKDVWQQKVREDGDEAYSTQAVYQNILASETAYHAAQQALKVAEKSALKANSTSRASADVTNTRYLNTTQTAPSVAGLSSLEVLEEMANVKLSKSKILAPFAGTITNVAHEKSEFAAAGSAIMTLQTDKDLEMIANVPETDAFKLAMGQKASVTLDAFPNEEDWEAEVVAIAPAARVIEGLPTYEVTLRFVKADERLKPGLSSNILVHAQEKKDVFAIPRRAIISQDDRRFVRVIGEDEFIAEKEVTTGLLGSDGKIEIVSGLGDGDEVIISNTNGSR